MFKQERCSDGPNNKELVLFWKPGDGWYWKSDLNGGDDTTYAWSKDMWKALGPFKKR